MRLKRGVAPIAGKEPVAPIAGKEPRARLKRALLPQRKRKKAPSDDEASLFYFEREKRFEPSTLTLARLCSTS